MNKNIQKIGGWVSFFLAIGLFVLQIVFLFLHARFQVEYSDGRFFYLINIFSTVFLGLAILLLTQIGKKQRLFGGVAIASCVLANGILLAVDVAKTRNIISISPNFKHVVSIKENKKTG
ncbi:hypothetical protein ACFSCZ_10785 [Siminovitchia sediminis]|uniref:Uncharacterized protein n=1 Tax=Siminovitchia sediminis TaxID=1274353 RepID=A0ABW4KJI5_9BACI